MHRPGYLPLSARDVVPLGDECVPPPAQLHRSSADCTKVTDLLVERSGDHPLGCVHDMPLDQQRVSASDPDHEAGDYSTFGDTLDEIGGCFRDIDRHAVGWFVDAGLKTSNGCPTPRMGVSVWISHDAQRFGFALPGFLVRTNR